jgi:hypothetical protein
VTRSGRAIRQPTVTALAVLCRRVYPPVADSRNGQGREVTSVSQEITLTVNGAVHTVSVEPRRLLVHVLREDLGLTGTHIGCDTSSCGRARCTSTARRRWRAPILAVQADGAEIRTVEGLATNGQLHPIQRAFHEHHGPAVRLLHARHDDGGGRDHRAGRRRALARSRSGRRSRATSAAARLPEHRRRP